jgi:hypothetical protein
MAVWRVALSGISRPNRKRFTPRTQSFSKADARWAIGGFVVRWDRLISARQIEIDRSSLLVARFQNNLFETLGHGSAFHFPQHQSGCSQASGTTTHKHAFQFCGVRIQRPQGKATDGVVLNKAYQKNTIHRFE